VHRAVSHPHPRLRSAALEGQARVRLQVCQKRGLAIAHQQFELDWVLCLISLLFKAGNQSSNQSLFASHARLHNSGTVHQLQRSLVDLRAQVRLDLQNNALRD